MWLDPGTQMTYQEATALCLLAGSFIRPCLVARRVSTGSHLLSSKGMTKTVLVSKLLNQKSWDKPYVGLIGLWVNYPFLKHFLWPRGCPILAPSGSFGKKTIWSWGVETASFWVLRFFPLYVGILLDLVSADRIFFFFKWNWKQSYSI